MSFSDLLKQPLPSKSDTVAMESVDIKNIKTIITDSENLVSDYNESRNSITQSLKVIRMGIQNDKFVAAKNSIKKLEAKVKADYNDIERTVKSLESKGLTEKNINKICATLSIGLVGAGIAGGIARNKYKEAKENNPTGSDYAEVHSSWDKHIDRLSKYPVKKGHSKDAEETIKQAELGKVNELKNLDALKAKTKKLGTISDTASVGIVGASITTAMITSCFSKFSKVRNSYKDFYETTLKTLDDLSEKCDKESKNIKECLVDYVVLSNNIQMLMESDESDNDFNDEDYTPDSDTEDTTSPSNTEECGNNCECSNETLECGDNDIEEDIDISDMSDADLDELEDELADSDVEDITDGIEEVDLTPEEEREADDFMSLAATTELVRDELSATERAEFYADPVQAQIAVVEGFMLESDFADGQMVTEKFFNKTRVQFSKEDRKHQLFAVALNASARAHNDPDYIKLQKVQQMRRVLKARIRKKYRSEAVRRVKVYMQRLKASKSNILSKIGEKLHKDNKG